MDAIETEEGCFYEEELNGPDDFLFFYEETAAKDEDVTERSNRRARKKRARKQRGVARAQTSACEKCHRSGHSTADCLKGSDAGRAPVTDDDSSGRVHDQDATKATRNSKPLSICSTAYATGISKKGEEAWRAYLLAIFLKCMI